MQAVLDLHQTLELQRDRGLRGFGENQGRSLPRTRQSKRPNSYSESLMPRRPPDSLLFKGEPSTTLETDCSSLSLVPTGFPAGKDSGHILLYPSKNPNSSKQSL